MARPPKFNQEKANKLRAEGKRIVEISKILNCSYGSLKTYFCRQRQSVNDLAETIAKELNKLGVTNKQELIVMARPCKCDKLLILELHAKGLTSKVIGEKANTSPANVRKIIQRYKDKGVTNELDLSVTNKQDRNVINKSSVTNELNKTLTNKTESKPNHPQIWGQDENNESQSKTNMQDENKTESETKKEKQKKIVIRMMEKGKTEQEIAEHYGWGKDDVHMIILQYQFEQL